jgi:nucleoporin POM152
MSGTPRLGSSYPSTPDSQKRRSTPASSTSHTGASSQTTDSKKTLPLISTSAASTKTANSPLIPVNLIDAPSQRFYVFAVYVGLIAWRLYDWGNLLEHDGDSLWLFIKWVGTDAIVFLYALPALRIPWMEWSNPVIMAVFLLHAILNGMLMFRIPVGSSNPGHDSY